MRTFAIAALVLAAGSAACENDLALGSTTDDGSSVAGSSVMDPSVTDTSTTGDVATSTSTTHAPTSSTSTTDTSTTGSTTEPEVFDYEGEHVVVDADPGLELCGGAMQHLDDFVARAAPRFAVEAPAGGDRIRYTWVLTEFELQQHCSLSDDLSGCAKGGSETYSLLAPHVHELVHNVSFRIKDGYPPAFFVEGAAVAHHGYKGRVFREYADSNIDIVSLMTLSFKQLAATPGAYAAAGQYNGYLIGHHGIENYLHLYEALPAGASLATIDQVFQDILQVSVADSVDHYTNGDHDWRYGHIDALLSECNAPELEWDGELLDMEGEVECTRTDAIGPYDGRVTVQYTLEVQADALYELRLAGDDQESTIIPDEFANFGQPSTAVSIYPCRMGSVGFLETQVGGTPRRGGLSPGRHTLRLHAPLHEPGPVAFTLKRLPPDPP
ncbi:hypothetical protein [Nannocystis sp. SCPEA4]|uniref:hypothetical protein n=1 Tax=Nannocystis sp. SCPEA4 TaxID=2996787 RepID=UPI00226EC3B9|nr:hypothetical protein [Nannocystis sp. SCPEA4]MCY1058696.1 hypothetical protein [Nannocystis sp. SCPEA4]